MKARYLVCLFLMCCTTAIGQQLIFSDPVKLNANINSDAEELNPILSADGKVLYFSRAFDKNNTGGEFAGLDIWYSMRGIGSSWVPATNKGTKWNNRESNTVIGVSKDNNSVYLLNAYKSKQGVAFSRRVNGEWTTPELIPMPGLYRTDFVGYFMNTSFDVLLISMNGKGSVGQEDLYVCLKDSVGSWSSPLNLGPVINTEGYEIAPFLSEDKKKLYFSSNGHPANLGDADIYVAERLYDSWTLWSKPKNLGNKINSPKFDAYFSVSGDSVSYFVSNRDSKLADIYTSKVGISASSMFADSVNRMIEDTKRLLLELQGTDNAKGLESIDFVPFTNGSAELTQRNKDQLTALVRRYDPAKVKIVEICRYESDAKNGTDNSLGLERQRSVLNYVVTAGVAKQKIITKTLQSQNNAVPKTNGIEIRFYLFK